ncbi:SMI1 / KNR4 family protein [Flavobacterium branchiophilum NBRC 15030 = ATCC 35035]|uniref:SMI1/KNR4 family protein SUKH-1 n=1 Tax=Flavobacterium branchiophilum TaxID=55197 RepID=A0A543G8D3_9FLAO|nr:SMI1/KNR4 family protein [Flavobacterium branchiophilum]OXA76908.1 SMI1 / KNR4 family protein [Flavobacterium branchiophilum NBRC 15030 = ATCC 35035]TQM42234.1 SMI1/KNR4 family protein SUKH-1 [Flavobacterium branchiophilum]GEM54314.1 SMI1/KNR4 family protein [Flavobacterium branchiophilum NBRC 15030 = ATCC 35035]
MENLSKKYIEGLKKAYYEREGQEIWDHLESIKHGIHKEDEERLKQAFPQIPDSLIELLQFVDGTYWSEFQNEKIAFFFLGSDMFEYPYYLMSVQQILESNSSSYLADYIDRVYDEVEVDNGIISDSKALNWLHFSDCMNNGGTSQLYIDFSPSANGKVGQIVRYTHDPDELVVIADSFDAYLQLLIEADFQFIVDYMME